MVTLVYKVFPVIVVTLVTPSFWSFVTLVSCHYDVDFNDYQIEEFCGRALVPPQSLVWTAARKV